MYYLAGPMTGLPDFNYPAFTEACKILRDHGYSIVSPHEVDYNNAVPGSLAWWDYMAGGIKVLVDCTDIIMLPGWHNSRGATLERTIALSLGMGVYTYEYNTDLNTPVLTLIEKGKRDFHDD